MKKLRLFLETSAIGNLVQHTKPKEMADMNELWEMIKKGEYEIVISTTVTNELMAIKEDNIRDLILEYLDQVVFERQIITAEMHIIAKMIIHYSILTENSYNDCTHIACALISGCDCIVSYNFRHLVNIRTIKGVRSISLINGYGDIDIITADTLIKKGGAI